MNEAYTIQSPEDIRRQMAEQNMADCRNVQELLDHLDALREADFSSTLADEFYRAGSQAINNNFVVGE